MPAEMTIAETAAVPAFTHSDAPFWSTQWKLKNIAWHKEINHPMLVKHLELLTEGKSALRFLFPLCGKAVDMAWLASQGHWVVGIEYVQDAIEQFFAESKLTFKITELDGFKLYSTEDGHIKIYNGDFFQFQSKYEPAFDCVWDRGAIVAIPFEERVKYAEKLMTLLAPKFKYLLDSFEYDTKMYQGPPHVVTLDEIKKHYGATCSIKSIDEGLYCMHFVEGLDVTEKVYLLEPLI